MTDDKRILEVLSRLEQRMTELEGGRVMKPQKTPPHREPTISEQICEKVKADLQTKKIVLLSDYGRNQEIRWARDILAKDKSVSVIAESGRVFVMKSEEAPTPKQTGKYPKRASFQSSIDKIKAVLDTGKSLTAKKIQKILGRSHGMAHEIMLAFAKIDGYKVDKIDGHGKRLLRKVGFEAEHQPAMRKKSPYQLFLADRLRYYKGQGGMNNSDAWRSAVADWNSRPKLAQSHFPAFQSVKPDFQTILAGVLEKLAKKGVAVDYRGVAYALDISTEAEYKALVEEIIAKWSEIKACFGVSAELKWDGKTLKLR